jgi:hypothetical protein
MVTELNETYQRFGNKFPMIGIAKGFFEDEQETQKLFKESKLRFKQIDNTKGVNKEIKLKKNVVCTPAKILIGSDGKVILNGCGGKTKSLDDELERLIKQACFLVDRNRKQQVGNETASNELAIHMINL